MYSISKSTQCKALQIIQISEK